MTKSYIPLTNIDVLSIKREEMNNWRRKEAKTWKCLSQERKSSGIKK